MMESPSIRCLTAARAMRNMAMMFILKILSSSSYLISSSESCQFCSAALFTRMLRPLSQTMVRSTISW